MNKLFLFCFLSFLLVAECKGNSKGIGKFERKFRECSSSGQCNSRSNDNNCVYKCVNKDCYTELIEGPKKLLEFGEVDNEFKKSFEKCFNYKERIRRSG